MRAGAAVVAMTAVVVGCSTSAGTLDGPATEQVVAAAIADRYASEELPDLEVGDAACPNDVKLEAGTEFSCTVALGEVGSLPVDVTVTSADGELDVAPAAAIVVPAEVAQELKAALKEEFGRSFQVDCGDDGPAVRAPNDSLTCRARDKNSRRSVKVTVADAAGTLTFEIDDPSS